MLFYSCPSCCFEVNDGKPPKKNRVKHVGNRFDITKLNLLSCLFPHSSHRFSTFKKSLYKFINIYYILLLVQVKGVFSLIFPLTKRLFLPPRGPSALRPQLQPLLRQLRAPHRRGSADGVGSAVPASPAGGRHGTGGGHEAWLGFLGCGVE